MNRGANTTACTRNPAWGIRRFLAAGLFLAALVAAHADSWFNSSWSYRQTLTVTGTGTQTATLTDFPVLIHLSNSGNTADLFTYSKSNFYDLVFTSSDGTTQLAHEIVEYSGADLWVWVKIPTFLVSSSGTDNVMYAYYGNSGSKDQSDKNDVWDSNFKVVQHLDETGSTLYDSTANAVNGIRGSTVTTGTGKINSAQTFTGNGTDYVSMDNLDTDGWTQFTIECWVKMPGVSNSNTPSITYPRIIQKGIATGNSTQISLCADDSAGQPRLIVNTSGTAVNTALTTDTTAYIPSASFAHITLTWNSGTWVYYFNGSQKNTGSLGGSSLYSISSQSPIFLLANDNASGTGDRPLTGSIDEMHFSNTARDKDWAMASFSNQSTPVPAAGVPQVYLGGTVYSDEESSPLSGASVKVVIGGTIRGTATSDSNGTWGTAIPSSYLTTKGTALAAYIDAASPNSGAVFTEWGGSNIYNLKIYKGDVIVRNDNSGSPSVADFYNSGAAGIGNSPLTAAASSSTATLSAYNLYIPSGTTFIPGSGTTLSVGGVLGAGTLETGDGSTATSASALNVVGTFAPNAFTCRQGSVTFTGTGSTGAYTFYSATINASGYTRTATGAWTVSNGLTLTAGTFAPGSYTHNVAGVWNADGVTFAPASGTIRLTGTGNIGNASGNSTVFKNLTIAAGATRTVYDPLTVTGNLTIESGAVLAGGTYVVTLSGNWTNQAGSSGYTSSGAGGVYFTDASQTSAITGTTNFSQFTSTAANAKVLAFESGSTTTIETFTVGYNASLIRYDGSGSDQWYLKVTTNASTTSTYSVSDSNAVTALVANGATDLGNNTNWTFGITAVTWTGTSGDGLWSTAGNWSTSVVPATAVTAVIPSGISTWPTIGSANSYTIQNLTIASGANLTVSSSAATALSFYNALDNLGTLYRIAGSAKVGMTDINSGTVVYQGTGGAIQNYDSGTSSNLDYYNLTIDSSGETFTIGSELHVVGDLVVNAGTLNLSGYNLVVDGNLTVSSGASITLGTGTVTVAGNVSGSGTITGGSGTVNVGGNWAATNFVKGTTTVSLSGTSASLAAGSFYNLTAASGASVTMSGAVTVANNLVAAGSLAAAGYNLSVTGAVSDPGTAGSLSLGSGTATFAGDFAPTSLSAGTGTVIFNGTSHLGGSYTFNNLTVNSGATLYNYVTLGTIRSTTVSGTIANKGTVYRQGGDYISQSDATQGTVVYAGTTGNIQSYSGDDYYSLTINAGGYTLSLAASEAIDGTLTITAGTLSIGSSNTLQVAGNWSNSGTAAVGGTVELTGTGSTAISGTTTFTNLTSAAAGKAITMSGTQTISGGAFTITGTSASPITLTGGALTLSSATASAYYATITNSTVSATSYAYFSTLSGSYANWTTAGYTWLGNSTVWTDTGNWSPSGTPTTGDTVTIPSGCSYYPKLTAARTVKNLTIESGGSLDTAAQTLTITGTFENQGTLYRQPMTYAYNDWVSQTDTDSGTTVYYGTTATPQYIQDYGSQDYCNLAIGDATKGSTSVRLGYALGTTKGLTIITSSTLDSQSKTITVYGNWANSGTFTYGTGTVVFDDASQTTTISGTNTFYNLKIITAGKTVRFPTGVTTAVTATFTATGDSSAPVYLLSASSGTSWNFNPVAASVSYAYVKDSDIITSTLAISAGNSSSGGHNDVTADADGNWAFTASGTYAVWSTSATTNSWTLTGNWVSGNVPTSGSGYTVVIPSGAGVYPTLTTAMSLTDLTIESGASLNIDNYAVTVSGTYANAGTLYRSSGASMNVTDTAEGTVVYQGTVAGTIQNYSTGDDYYNLQIGDGSSSVTWSSGADIQTANSLTVALNATISTGSYALTATGAAAVAGTLTAGSGAVTLTGAATIAGIMTASSGTTTFSSTVIKGGTFNANGGTVVLTDAPSLGSDWNFCNLTINSSGTVTLGADLTVTGDLTLTAGTLNLSGKILSLGGNLTKTSGAFNSGTSGTISFIDTTKTSAVTGSITWPNLTIGTSGSPMGGKTVQFEAGKTQTVSGVLTLYGASGSPVYLRSSSAGTLWLLAPPTSTAYYVDVKDSDITNTAVVTANSSINSGNNDIETSTDAGYWNFPRPSSFTWVGGTSTAWALPANWAEGNGTYYPGWDGAALTITTDTVTLPSSASYWPSLSAAAVTVDSITIPSGAQLSLSKGLGVTTSVTNYGTITLASGGSIGKNDSAAAHGGTIAMTAAGAVDSLATTSYCNLTLSGSAAYMNSAALTVNGNLVVNSGSTLTLGATSGAYTVGGNLTGTGTLSAASVTGGSLTVTGTIGTTGTAFGTLSAPATLSVGGTLNAATFTNNSGTVNVTGAGTIVGTWTSTGKRFYNLTVNPGASNTVALSGNLTATGNLAISTGALNSAGKTITVYGNWTNSVGTAGFTYSTSTVVIDNSGTTSHTLTGNTTFYNLTSTTNTVAPTITFTAGTTTTIASGGTLILTGASSYPMTLKSSASASWYLDMKTTVAPTLSWLSIAWSDLMSSTGDVPSLSPTNPTDGGNNDAGTDGTTTSKWILFINYIWTGTTSTAWSLNTNWSPTGVPTSIDKVTIPSSPTGSKFPLMDSSAATTVTVASLTMATGSSLGLQTHNLTVTGTVSKAADATLSLYDSEAVDTSATTQGANYLMLNGIVNYNAPSGTHSIQNVVASGDDYAALSVTGAATYTAASAIQTPSLTLGMSGGSATFSGGLTATSSFTVNAGAYAVAITGASNSITPAATFANTGTLALGTSGGSTAFTGALTATAPSGITVAGAVTAASMNLLSATTATLTVGASSTSLATGGTGTIQIAGAVTDGTNSYTLTLGDASQTGAVTVAGAITVNGLATGSGSFDLSLNGDGENSNFSTVDTAVVFANTGTLKLGSATSDKITFTGGVTSVAGAVQLAGTVAATDNALNLNKAVTLQAATTVSAGTGKLTLGGTVGGANALTLDTCASTSVFGGAVSAITGLTVDTGAAFTPASTVAVAGALTLTSGTLTMGGNTLTVSGDISHTSGILSSTGTLTLNGGTAQTVNLADATYASSIANLTLNNANGATLTNTATFTWSGNCTLTAGSLKLANLSGQTIGGNITGTAASSKLDLSAIASGNSAAVSGTVGTSAATALTALAAPAGTLNVAGTVWNVTTLTLTATPGTIAFTGSAAQTIVPAGQTFGTVTATGSGGVTLTGTAYFTSLAVSTGETFSIGGATATSLNLSGTGTNVLQTGTTGGLRWNASGAAASLNFTGAAPEINNGYYGGLQVTAGSATWIASLNGNTAAQPVTLQNFALDLNGKALTVSNMTTTIAHTLSTASSALTLSGTNTFSGGLTANATLSSIAVGTSTLSASALTVTSGSCTIGAGSVTVTGALTVNGGTLTVNGTPTTFAAGSLTESSGTITNTSSYGLSVSGDVTVAGTFGVTTASTITMTGASKNLAATSQLYNLAVSGSAGLITHALSLAGTLNVSGTLNDTANNLGIAVTGTSTITGTLNAGSGTDSFAAVGGTGTLNASSGSTTISGGMSISFFNHDSGSVTLTGGSTGAYIFYNLTINGSATATGDWTVNRNWTYTSGTFTWNSHAVILATTTTATIAGSASFYSLSCTAAGKTIQFTDGTTQTISGTLTLTGAANSLITLTHTSSSAWTLNNSGTASVSYVDVSWGLVTTASITAATSHDNGNNGSTAPCWVFSASDLTWDGSSDTDWDTPANWDRGYVPNTTDRIIIPSSGVTNLLALDGTARTVVQATVNGTLNAAVATSVTLTGTAAGTLTVASGATIGSPTYTTWIMTGSGATIASSLASTIGNLTVNPTSGTVSLGADCYLTGLALASGTLAASTYNLYVAGNITQTTGLITSSANLTLDGSALQTASLAVSGYASSLTNLVLDNAAGATLTNSVIFTWSGNCTLTAGTLKLAAVTGQTVGGNVTGTAASAKLDLSQILAGSSVTISGTVGTNSTTALTALVAPAGTLNAGGSIWNVTTLTNSSGTVAFTAAGTIYSANTFYTLSKTTGSTTTLNTSIGANSAAVSAGTLALANNGLTITAGLTLSGGALTHGTGLLSCATMGNTGGTYTGTGTGTLTITGAFTQTSGAGTTTLGGKTVTAGTMTATAASGTLNLNAAAIELTTASGANSFAGIGTLSNTSSTLKLSGNSSSLAFHGTSTLGALTVNATGVTLTDSGATNDATSLTVNSGSTVTALTGTIATSGSGTFNGTVAGAGNLSIGTTAAINTTSINLSGTQTYTGAATLGASPTLTGTTVSFGSTLDGGSAATYDLTISGNASFSGIVGATSLKSLGVSGTGAVHANVTTSGAQTYTGTVTLYGDITFTANAGSLVAFKNATQAVTGNTSDRVLAIATANAEFDGPVSTNIASVSVGGTTAINTATITSTLTQTYTGAVTLGAATNLTGTTVTFYDTVSGGSKNLTVTGAAQFGNDSADTVTGVAILSVTGNASVYANITSTGAQTWAGAVTLYGDITFTANSGSLVWFKSTVAGSGSAQAFAVATANAEFDAAVSGNIASIAVGGTSAVNTTAMTSSGTQSYTGTVTLGNSSGTTFTTTTSDITFNAAIVGATYYLKLTTGSTAGAAGDIYLKGNVSNVQNGLYEGRTLYQGTGGTAITVASTLGASTAGDITFHLDNYQSLNASNAVNAGSGAFKIYPRGTGSIEFAATDSTNVTAAYYYSTGFSATAASFTVGDSSYTGDIYVGNDAATTVAYSAIIRTTGTTYAGNWSASGYSLTLHGTYGATYYVSFTGSTSGSATISLGTGTLTVNGPATIADDTTITANGGLIFNGTIADSATGTHSLTLNSSGTTTLAGTVGSAVNTLLSLTTDASGTTALNGGSVYATTQTWNDAVTLGSGTTLTGTDVSFVSTLNSFDTTYRALTINASGATSFAGTVGATNPLASITTDAGGTTAINTPAITTNTTQTFNDALSLGVTANLTGTAVYFYGTVDGNAHNLTVTGAAQFGNGTADTVTDMGTLLVTLTSSIYADITTTGTQTWTGNATLGSNVTLTASSARFYGTVTGAAHSLAISGAAVFGNGTADTVAGVTTLQVSGITDIYTASMGATTQTYGDTTGTDTITLHAGATFTGTTVTFNAPVVGGTNSLTVSGNAIFGDTTGDDTVTGVVNLSVSGTTGINTTTITTTGTQTYDSNTTGTDTITLGVNVVLGGTAITINSPVAGGTHSLTIANTGIFTTAASGDITAGGGFSQTGAGTNTLAGDISTANTDIAFATAVTLSGAVVLDTDTGAGNISIPSITGAGFNLGLISGSGTTTVSGNATGIGVLSLQENAATSTGSVSFQGNLGATGITTFARNYPISLTGATTSISTTAVTFSNTGTLTLGNATADSLTFAAGVTATAPSSVSVSGTVAASGTGVITLGDSDTPVSIAATSIIGGSGTGTITLSGTTTLASGTVLTLGQGSAANIVAGTIATTAVGNLEINSTAVSASTIESFIPTSASALTITNIGTGGLSFSGDAGAGGTPLSSVTFASTISSTGTASFNGKIYATAMTVNAGTGAYGIAFNAGGTIAGAVTFNNTGNLAVGNDSADSFTFTGGAAKTVGPKSFAGYVNASGSATLNFGTAGTATITADAWLGGTTGAITLWDTVINDGVTLDLGNLGAAPVVVNSVAGVASGSASNLTIDNAGANATITGDIATDIGTVTITKSGGTMLFSGDVTAATLDPQAGAYAVAMNGSTGTSTSTTITNAVTFLNTGTLVLGDAAEDAFTFTAGMTSTAVASNTFQGTVSTAGASGQDIVLDDLAVGANGLIVNTGTGASGTGLFTVAGTVSIAASLTLDLASSNFAVGTVSNGTTATDGILRLTGEQTTHTVTNFDLDSGTTEYYGSSAGSIFSSGIGSAGNEYYNFQIASGSGVKTADGDIQIANNWTNNGGISAFGHGNHTVSFVKASGSVEIRGANLWYIFHCSVPGLTVMFQNDTEASGIAIVQRIAAGGTFYIHGTGLTTSTAVKLTRLDSTGGDPASDGTIADPTDDDLFWFFDLLPGATLDMEYATVWYSNARENPVTVPDNVEALPYLDTDTPLDTSDFSHFCYKWLKYLFTTFSYTEDSDYDGKIDRIRVTTEADVGNDFSGFTAVVEGYTVTGYYRSASIGKTFYILLEEKPYLDTGATPDWYISKNTTLFDTATGSKRVHTLEAGSSGYTRSDGTARGAWMTPGDTAWPRVGYTLQLPENAQNFVQFSEEVGNATTTDVGLGTITKVSGSTGVKEALSAATSQDISSLASSTTGTFTGTLADLGTAPVWIDSYDGQVKNAENPRYPATTGYDTDNADSYALASGKTDSDRPAFTLSGGAWPNNVHRLSDVLVSMEPSLATDTTYFAWPLWAKDSVITDIAAADYETLTGAQASSSTIGLVRDFTGGKWLRDQDITLEARTGSGMGQPSFVFDGNVGSAYLATSANGPTGLWLPAFTAENNAAGFSGIVPATNTATASIASTAGGTSLWDFAIPASNAKIKSVSTIGFFLHLAGTDSDLYVGRLAAAQGVTPTDWYRRVRPFSFDIHDVTLQRSGVTIMNNVIDPTTGETVRLSYQLTKSGPVTIQVFTLDGDVVQVLFRGTRAAGDYTATWDGRNKGGRAVARGMYFIRIVGPEIDEIRKVMIVK